MILLIRHLGFLWSSVADEEDEIKLGSSEQLWLDNPGAVTPRAPETESVQVYM